MSTVAPEARAAAAFLDGLRLVEDATRAELKPGQRPDATFREPLARKYASEAWAFTALPGLAALLEHLFHLARQSIFRGEDGRASRDYARQATERWLNIARQVRQRAEFYLRHEAGDEEARAYLARLPAWEGKVEHALDLLLRQKRSLARAQAQAARQC